MRARKRPWTEKEMAGNDKILEDAEGFKGNWKNYFQNDNPIRIEIGCGKGGFINETAKKNKNTNYIALEREKEVIVVGARRARLENNNIAFITTDVADLTCFFAPHEVSRIYINFCDPWPNRKKWQKRRLTHRNFLTIYENVLDAAGEIFFKTDNAQLFEFSLNEFCAMNWSMRNITLDLHKSDYIGNIMTEYEEKFHIMGMPIYRLEAFRK